MEKSAVVQIQESANIPSLLEQLKQAGFPVAALP